MFLCRYSLDRHFDAVVERFQYLTPPGSPLVSDGEDDNLSLHSSSVSSFKGNRGSLGFNFFFPKILNRSYLLFKLLFLGAEQSNNHSH